MTYDTYDKYVPNNDYGDWVSLEGNRGRYELIQLATYSNYAGGVVERANHLWLKTRFLDGKVKIQKHVLIPVTGGHGAEGFYVLRSLFLDQGDPFQVELQAILKGLEEYPVISEPYLCLTEEGLIQEAWDTWVLEDFRSALKDTPELENLTDDELRSLFEHCRIQSGNQWVCESGGSMEPSFSLVVDYVTNELDVSDLESITGS